jgi:hypothetical protein
LQRLLLQVEVTRIIVHEAGEPNAVIDFLDAEFLSCQHDSCSAVALPLMPSLVAYQTFAIAGES